LCPFLFKPHRASAAAARVAPCAGRWWMTTKTRRKPATRTEPVRLTEEEKEEQEALVLKHQEWAKKLAGRLVKKHSLVERLGLDEAEGVAVTALWDAPQRYRRRRGPFRPYAAAVIRGRVRDAARWWGGGGQERPRRRPQAD
jgi:Sigma-70 region 2